MKKSGKLNISKESFERTNEIESFLYNYKSINLSIKNLKMELESSDETAIGSIEYKEGGGKTNKVYSSVESSFSRKQILESRIIHIETKINQINNALGILEDIERKVLENFYIQGKSYIQFYTDLAVSERTCQRIKRKALDKMIISIYGI